MVYEDSKLDREQIKTVHRLVAQVSRAFFDPPYVIILDKMMTKDVWVLAQQSISAQRLMRRGIDGCSES
jgi:hypothetical protein